jgi:DNA-binding transcriptional regulator YiaG
MKPNAEGYRPDHKYISSLVESTGLSQPKLGRVLDVKERTIRRWCSGETPAPYMAQFALECLVLNP